MLFDLHSHTTASDGALEPQALLRRALDQGVTHLAITDHDTVAAYQQITGSDALQIICGIEFSTTWGKTGIHILGLNIDPSAEAIREGVARQKDSRLQRATMIADQLRKYGVEDALAGARAQAASDHIGRPHFARHLVAIGFVRSEQEAFRKYLGSGKSCDFRQHWAEPRQIVEWIRDAGGTAVLAHPAKYGLTRSRLLALTSDFRAWGGVGLEVVSGLQLPSVTRDLAQLCCQLSLYASWGSDFHQPGQPWAELGRFSTPPANISPIWDTW
ncbi:MAG TPA: PHP domain-containing protein [Porticoccaceae bacterium]